jgi:hypothetical protein
MMIADEGVVDDFAQPVMIWVARVTVDTVLSCDYNLSRLA